MDKSLNNRGKKAGETTIPVQVPASIALQVEQLIAALQAATIANPATNTEPLTASRSNAKVLILNAIDKFIELRHSEWGQVGSQTGTFNPQVTRYDMLQKFRRAIEEDQFTIEVAPRGESFVEAVFRVWLAIATAALPDKANCWGHPVTLQSIYAQLPFMRWDDFLSQLDQISSHQLELVPSRVQNWQVGQRSVGALTFHQALNLAQLT